MSDREHERNGFDGEGPRHEPGGEPERPSTPYAWWEQPPPPPPVPVQAPPPRRRGRAMLAAVVASLVLVSAGVGIGWGLFRPGGSAPTQRAASERPIAASPQTGPSSGRLDIQAIADKVEPGVVNINTFFDASSFGSGSGGSQSQPLGAGTGMVLTSSGEVLTNNHVVEGATSIEVTVAGHSEPFDATVIGVDPTDDVALIQLQGASGLSTVKLADSSSVTTGQVVVALGNALGQGGAPTVSRGSVTALDRSITVGGSPGGPEHLEHLIQISASIAPGDSGGPIVNRSGQVVGMITAAQRQSGNESSHVGYAIATNSALPIVNQIRSGHATADIIIGQPGFMGVQVRNLDRATASRLGLGVTQGALVIDTFEGTPAARAGVTAGSVITAVDGTKVSSADALGPIIHRYDPGQSIHLTWIDQDGSHTATLQLISGPAV